MDAKLTENDIFVWGTGKDFVFQFIKLTFIYKRKQNANISRDYSMLPSNGI